MSNLEVNVNGPNVEATLHLDGRPQPIVITMDVEAATEASMAFAAAVGVIAKTAQAELKEWVQTG